MNEGIAIERVIVGQSRDLWARLAQLHQQEIDGGFLSSLGGATLAALYSALASSPEAVLLVARERASGRILGFICGSIDARLVYRHVLIRRGAMLIPALLPRLFSYHTVWKISETVLYPVRNVNIRDLPRAEILNFCVDRSCQRSGVGRALFQALAAQFRKRGVAAMKILTGASQGKAQRFYSSIGAQLAGRMEVHGGQESVLFRYDIPDVGNAD
jgi:ribosomal protein S18 acetylase RimI-like enzyme